MLQLLPQRSGHVNGNWNLATDSKFQSMIKNIDDFEIKIETKTLTEINNMNKGEMKKLLSEKQMLVIGFDDVYQDISDKNGQVQDILDFIKSGKSVIFSHDTTSYINYDKNDMYEKIADSEYGLDEKTSIYMDNWLFSQNRTWGLSLNTILRSVVGMDRYGITSTEQINGETVSALLKHGKALNSQSVDFGTLMTLAGDIAWQTNGSRKSSYAQTQAYTNNMLQKGSIGDKVTTTATKINDGAITQYPYVIGNNIQVAKTHGQYYQLALEQDRDINGRSDGTSDVVVWYCLSGSGSVYSESPNDARNNYYFYSKGNVIYTGAGHSKVDGDEEIQLFINAMVAAANVTAVKPEVDFVDTLNPDADIESARYYATDQSSWKEGENNILEKDMTFNINVKDYNMVSADLNQEDLDKQKMEISFFINDDKGSTLEASSEAGSSSDGAPSESEKVTNITNRIGTLKSYDGKTIEESADTFDITENNAFSLNVADIEQYLRDTGSSDNLNGYKKSCKLYVRVKSTVYLYGKENSNISWASIDLKQRQLFELN